MINYNATKCLNINNFIPRKLIERCGTEGIAIDEVIFLIGSKTNRNQNIFIS